MACATAATVKACRNASVVQGVACAPSAREARGAHTPRSEFPATSRASPEIVTTYEPAPVKGTVWVIVSCVLAVDHRGVSTGTTHPTGTHVTVTDRSTIARSIGSEKVYESGTVTAGAGLLTPDPSSGAEVVSVGGTVSDVPIVANVAAYAHRSSPAGQAPDPETSTLPARSRTAVVRRIRYWVALRNASIGCATSTVRLPFSPVNSNRLMHRVGSLSSHTESPPRTVTTCTGSLNVSAIVAESETPIWLSAGKTDVSRGGVASCTASVMNDQVTARAIGTPVRSVTRVVTITEYWVFGSNSSLK